MLPCPIQKNGAAPMTVCTYVTRYLQTAASRKWPKPGLVDWSGEEVQASAPGHNPQTGVCCARAEAPATMPTRGQAVGEGVGAVPNLDVVRNVIGDLFAEVALIHAGDGDLIHPVVRVKRPGEGRWNYDGAGGPQVLAVGRAETPSPIGQETPVEWSGQYPPGFLGAYVLDAVFAPIQVAVARHDQRRR